MLRLNNCWFMFSRKCNSHRYISFHYPGGTCLDGFNNFICRCRENYMGKTCAIIMDPCHGITCFNGGRCVTTVGFQAECACPHGFTGKRCGSRTNVCKNVKCHNGGTCVNSKVGDHSCACLNGFHGDLCELSTPQCTQISCQNGGICKQYINHTVCICPSEFAGEKCESSLMEFDERFLDSFSQNSCAKYYFSYWPILLILFQLMVPP